MSVFVKPHTIMSPDLTEGLSEFCMLSVGKHIYFSNAMIIIAVNIKALIMCSESETQKLE